MSKIYDPKKHVLLRENAYTDKELIELYIYQSHGISQVDHDPELLKKLQKKLGPLAGMADMIYRQRAELALLEDQIKRLKFEWNTIKDFLRKE